GRFPPPAHDGDGGLWRYVKGFEKIHDVKTLGGILKTVPPIPTRKLSVCDGLPPLQGRQSIAEARTGAEVNEPPYPPADLIDPGSLAAPSRQDETISPPSAGKAKPKAWPPKVFEGVWGTVFKMSPRIWSFPSTLTALRKELALGS
ncbi:MAG: hypothetical protein QF593_03065, partial [Nitrospinota bacterium]|nr:hypothetical protein [Nitrospinota bacterium]